MRIYLPGSLSTLARVLESKAVEAAGGGPLTAYAPTGALAAELGTDDPEELEYQAMRAAARASLRLLAAEGGDRRLVLAAEVPDEAVSPEREARVRVDGPVGLELVVSGHVDEDAARPDIAAAAAALAAADGDAEAVERAESDAERHELLWYATQELRYL
ncbi:DUF6912 family protein [Allonocardiopsis opalescens]|uniref:Uncharacterized protein n=1 Tax=Allonocardiopsis opalescens TaxID=1144618 RepID=A0A2T0QC57_9ACTN|nr:hypothetical protein [Allonocardiopsis opalescens]PRY01534.1 hypothetical protein CLV72_101116 [Allonocardiopsis opalescens]